MSNLADRRIHDKNIIEVGDIVQTPDYTTGRVLNMKILGLDGLAHIRAYLFDLYWPVEPEFVNALREHEFIVDNSPEIYFANDASGTH